MNDRFITVAIGYTCTVSCLFLRGPCYLCARHPEGWSISPCFISPLSMKPGESSSPPKPTVPWWAVFFSPATVPKRDM